MSNQSESLNVTEEQEEEEIVRVSPQTEFRPTDILDRVVEMLSALTERQQKDAERQQRDAERQRKDAEGRQRDMEDRQAYINNRILDRLEDLEIIINQNIEDRTPMTTNPPQSEGLRAPYSGAAY